jgi:hypothetical protein
MRYENMERVVEIAPPYQAKETSDMIVVRVEQREHLVTREFRFQALVDHPVIWQADGNQSCEWGCAVADEPETAGDRTSGASLRFADVPCGGKHRYGIRVHPPCANAPATAYGILGPIVIPEDDCEFRAFIGLADGAGDPGRVELSVTVVDACGVESLLAQDLCTERKWKPISADLSSFMGQSIRVKLAATCDSSAVLAAWGEPRIVLTDSVLRLEAGG